MDNITVGRHTYGHNKIKVFNMIPKRKILIGNFCSIAAGCLILLGADHKSDYISTFPFGHIKPWVVDKTYKNPISKGDVIIGNDVWIGSSATILSGVTIGDGAIIGAQAVVTKNVLPYSIVAGNPAREVKKRFSDDQIECLLKIRWWDWPDKKIQNNMNFIMNTDINDFIKRFV